MISYLKWLARRWCVRRKWAKAKFEDNGDFLDLAIDVRLAALNIDDATQDATRWRFRAGRQ